MNLATGFEGADDRYPVGKLLEVGIKYKIPQSWLTLVGGHGIEKFILAGHSIVPAVGHFQPEYLA